MQKITFSGCDASFITYSNYLRHELANKCYVKRIHSTLGYAYKEFTNKYKGSKYEKALSQTQRRHLPTYVEKVYTVPLTRNLVNLIGNEERPDIYVIGFALPTKRRQTYYANDPLVYNYIKKRFLLGEEAGRSKAKPDAVADDMIEERCETTGKKCGAKGQHSHLKSEGAQGGTFFLQLFITFLESGLFSESQEVGRGGSSPRCPSLHAAPNRAHF